ncbi:MAG: tRNA (adenosine(37)-N6)-threonylcarbamoyltransferase complex dimerization subunit type 1 TsaB [Oscillospiraceae bacterium]|nr:tRNA (adenosine(37)-N6)-threonylcarbamoyltransferase complex dimerization subunit type 1 TsaB [Oscillospiraceae bacterium]
MKILAVDSSSLAASCAILEDRRLIGEFYIDASLTHSQTLMPMIDSLLKSTQTKLEDIDLFAVSCGPGSFTGLRIGISCVKGLAYATGKPCAAVSTLEGLCRNLEGCEGTLCAVMDARRGQVYTAACTDQNFTQPLIEDCAISVEELAEKLECMPKPIHFVGDGAVMCYNKLAGQIDGIKLAREAVRMQHAYSVGLAAAELCQQGKLVSAAELEPVYLRLAQAQRELAEKQAQKGE